MTDSLYDAAFQNLPCSMVLIDQNGQIVASNARWCAFARNNGGRADGYRGTNYLEVCAQGDNATGHEVAVALKDLLTGARQTIDVEYPCHSPTTSRWFLMQAWSFKQDAATWAAVMHVDITRRRLAEDAAREAAKRDPLSGLLNRRSFMDRAEQVLAETRRRGDAAAALFVDLNGFKAVNDTYGHRVGDEVIARLSRRLQDHVREADALARIGGDEFALVLNGGDAQAAQGLAARVQTLAAQPVEVEGQAIDLGCTVGVATFPEDGDSVGALLEAADRRMYRKRR
jgi:diguanylate cyclase (GGDEF)-like protein